MKKLIIGLSVLLLFSACGQSFLDKRRAQQEASRRHAKADSLALKVGVLPTLDCLPIYLAADHNLIDTLQVKLLLRINQSQIENDKLLSAKKLEGAVTDVKRIDQLRKKGIEMTVLGKTNAYWLLFGNRLARLKQVDQLGDKMVAMTRFSATDYLTDEALRGVKTSATVFRVQVNDVNLRLEMLRNNAMDALWLPEPQATQAKSYGHYILKDSRAMKEELGVVAFRASTLVDQRQRRQIAAFVKGYNIACDSLNKRGVKAYQPLIKKYYALPDSIIQRLPNLTYTHINLPNE